MHNDGWNSRYGQDDVAKNGNSNRNADGLVATEILIRDICPEQGNDIHPKGVEKTQTRRNLLTQTERSSLAICASCTGR